MVLAEGKCLHRAASLVPLSLLRAAPAPREAVAVLGTSVGFGPEKEQEVGMPGDITQVGCAAAGLLAASQRVGAALVPSALLSSAEPLQGLLVPCLLCPSTVPLVTCLGSCPSCDMLSPAALCPFSPFLGSCCSQGSAAAHVPPRGCRARCSKHPVQPQLRSRLPPRWPDAAQVVLFAAIRGSGFSRRWL